MRSVFALVTLCLAALSAGAFQPIPKESAKALGVTRGKPFSSGLVFVNGKYIAPPYVVERWGTGIRINSTPVTGQIVDWNEFLKTQDGAKVTKKEPEPAPAESPAPSAPPPADVKASSLDELFSDDPAPEKPEAAPKPEAASKPAAVPAAPKAKAATYALSGEFRHNDASKALLKRVNASRTEIDRILRAGGFICFGNTYSRVSGDRRTLSSMLDVLPELQQRSETVDDFRAGARSAGLVYLNEVLCEDLFKNRIDYRRIKERREKVKADQRWSQILGEASDPIF